MVLLVAVARSPAELDELLRARVHTLGLLVAQRRTAERLDAVVEAVLDHLVVRPGRMCGGGDGGGSGGVRGGGRRAGGGGGALVVS